MTKGNHELSIDELGAISGGGLKSAFDKVPRPPPQAAPAPVRRIGGDRFPVI